MAAHRGRKYHRKSGVDVGIVDECMDACSTLERRLRMRGSDNGNSASSFHIRWEASMSPVCCPSYISLSFRGFAFPCLRELWTASFPSWNILPLSQKISLCPKLHVIFFAKYTLTCLTDVSNSLKKLSPISWVACVFQCL